MEKVFDIVWKKGLALKMHVTCTSTDVSANISATERPESKRETSMNEKKKSKEISHKAGFYFQSYL